MALLRDHEQAVRETLGPERMHVETIFSETVDGVEYLYWCSTQGEGGSGVESSGRGSAKSVAGCLMFGVFGVLTGVRRGPAGTIGGV